MCIHIYIYIYIYFSQPSLVVNQIFWSADIYIYILYIYTSIICICIHMYISFIGTYALPLLQQRVVGSVGGGYGGGCMAGGGVVVFFGVGMAAAVIFFLGTLVMIGVCFCTGGLFSRKDAAQLPK